MIPKQKGFTIVELLIVIVVIAILAAISIVAYNGIQDRARSSTLQSDLSTAKKKLELYRADKGDYPSSAVILETAGIQINRTAYDVTANNMYYCYNNSTKQFALGARTVGNKAAYTISSASGLQQQGGGLYGDLVCQTVGLTGFADPNAYISNGYGTTGGWQAWTSGQ